MNREKIINTDIDSLIVEDEAQNKTGDNLRYIFAFGRQQSCPPKA
jgi:hypothetical protein